MQNHLSPPVIFIPASVDFLCMLRNSTNLDPTGILFPTICSEECISIECSCRGTMKGPGNIICFSLVPQSTTKTRTASTKIGLLLKQPGLSTACAFVHPYCIVKAARISPSDHITVSSRLALFRYLPCLLHQHLVNFLLNFPLPLRHGSDTTISCVQCTFRFRINGKN